MKTKRLETDVLIIGGGTAGCFAAYTLGKEAGVSVLIAEKANIKRSGCLDVYKRQARYLSLSS